MELMLKVDVPKLGKAGQVIKVRDGYARNYLLPKNLATDVSAENLRVIQKDAKKRQEHDQKVVKELKALGAKLADVTCTIRAKVAEGGHLYGSVTAANIADAFKAMELHVEEAAVRLENPIKEKGTYPVKIHLHPEVEVTTHVVVIEE